MSILFLQYYDSLDDEWDGQVCMTLEKIPRVY